MKYSFTCYGHENITATHPTTLMFTKDDFVTKKGDCIVGCKCDFELPVLREILNKNKREVTLWMEIDGLTEEVKGVLNETFDGATEMVIRKGDFLSKRTLVTNANKSALELSREMKATLRKGAKAVITLCPSDRF